MKLSERRNSLYHKLSGLNSEMNSIEISTTVSSTTNVITYTSNMTEIRHTNLRLQNTIHQDCFTAYFPNKCLFTRD